MATWDARDAFSFCWTCSFFCSVCLIGIVIVDPSVADSSPDILGVPFLSTCLFGVVVPLLVAAMFPLAITLVLRPLAKLYRVVGTVVATSGGYSPEQPIEHYEPPGWYTEVRSVREFNYQTEEWEIVEQPYDVWWNGGMVRDGVVPAGTTWNWTIDIIWPPDLWRLDLSFLEYLRFLSIP